MTAVLIAGPTASGKSAVAVAVAQRLGGVVVNADSQQVYAEWRVLSARPGQADAAAAPHRLYGHVPIAAAYSAGHWLADVAAVLAEARAAGRTPVIVGGTGLYFRALTQGLAPIPPTPGAVRARATARLADLGPRAFADELTRRDPATAARTDLANPRRVQRAWEVLETTGQGLAAWQAAAAPPLLPLEASRAVALMPRRDWLYARCDARFAAMMAAGALDEVRAVHALGLPPASPGLKAIGAGPLFAHLDGTLGLDEAAAAARTETRQYAKRQLTWVRNQMADWPRTETPEEALDLLCGTAKAGA